MTTPTPQKSVAELLEDLIAVAQQQLAVSQQTLQAVQASNGLVGQLLGVSQQALDVSQKTLASSMRIESLLGGGTGISIPAMLKVIYEKVLKAEKEKH